MSISVQRLDYMNVARGCAILMVIFVHTAQAVPGLSFFASAIAQYGQFGVQLFFVASAYTLCISFENRSNESKPIFYFYIRRFFRIAPLYYVAIVVYFLFFTLKKFYLEGSVSSFYPYSISNVLANIFLIHGFIPSANNNIVPGGWSIGTEMAFYLVFPFLFSFLKNGAVNHVKKVSIAIIMVFVINFVFQSLAVEYSSLGLDSSDFLYFNIVNQLPVFLLGILIYFFTKEGQGKRSRIPSLYLIILGMLFSLVAVYGLNSGMVLMRAVIPTISGVFFFFFVLFLMKINAGNIFLSKVGVYSFSMYVFHFVFAWGVVPPLAKKLNGVINPDATLLFYFAIVVCLTYVLASITEKHIEKRGIFFGKYLIDMNSRRNGVKEA